MTFAVLKERLHEYIDHAEEEKVKAIYTLVAEEISDYGYDEETLNLLEERQEVYKKERKGMSVEESMEHIKNELKKRGF